MYKHYSNYFYGNEVSAYGREHGYVDYATLAKAFDAVMNNSIIKNTVEIGYWEQESGFIDNSEDIERMKAEIEELEELLELKHFRNKLEARERIEELIQTIEELEEEQDRIPEIYQYFIVSDNGAEILERYNEIVFYNEELDMYVWGVTHWGTSWDYVLTDIKICEYKE